MLPISMDFSLFVHVVSLAAGVIISRKPTVAPAAAVHHILNFRGRRKLPRGWKERCRCYCLNLASISAVVITFINAIFWRTSPVQPRVAWFYATFFFCPCRVAISSALVFVRKLWNEKEVLSMINGWFLLVYRNWLGQKGVCRKKQPETWGGMPVSLENLNVSKASFASTDCKWCFVFRCKKCFYLVERIKQCALNFSSASNFSLLRPYCSAADQNYQSE